MTLKNIKLAALAAVAAFLAACGDTSDQEQARTELAARIQAFDVQETVGAWVPNAAALDSYEFFSSTLDFPYTTGAKTGRTVKNGLPNGRFFWVVQGDGTIKVSNVDAACRTRPLDTCKVISTVNIVRQGASMQTAKWTMLHDDNFDGRPDRTVVDAYKRKDLDLSSMAKGDFYLKWTESFDSSLPAKIEGDVISIRVHDAGAPIWLSTKFAPGMRPFVGFPTGGEGAGVVVPREFEVKGNGFHAFPVRMWFENFAITANATGGFILEYELHRRVQTPDFFDRTLVVGLAEYELTRRFSKSLNVIDKFVQGPVIRAGDRFNTFLRIDFDPRITTGGGANTILFTSATDGQVRHDDPNDGKVSGHRNFKWLQKVDGSVVMTFENGVSIPVNFVKAINGGFQVLFSVPHPQYEVEYQLHDLIKETSSALNAQTLPGHYTFENSDGSTINDVIFKADGSVSGVVNGYWFFDPSGDVISFECTTLQGNTVPDYQTCKAGFPDKSKYSYAHIRRMRFMHKDGNDYQVKYDGAVWGGSFTQPGEDYYTISWTYRMTRVGDQ